MYSQLIEALAHQSSQQKNEQTDKSQKVRIETLVVNKIELLCRININIKA